MNILKTQLDKVFLIQNKPFYDFRGKYLEIYNRDFLKKKFKLNFIQDDISISKKNVLRGIHGDSKTWKLVTCLYGKIKLLVVNNDEKSKENKSKITMKAVTKGLSKIVKEWKVGLEKL